MNNDLVVNKEHYAVMNNNLIRYQQTLNTSVLKLIRVLISQIDTIKSKSELMTYTLTFYELANIIGVDYHNLCSKKEYLNMLIEQLQQRVTSKAQQTIHEEISVVWCPTVKVDRGNNTITIRLNEDLKPYLMELKNRFTSVQLKNILSFSGKYSLRLYEILLSLYNEKGRTQTHFNFTVDEIRTYLDCNNKYAGFKDFNKYVILPALKEIQEISNNAVCELISKTKKGKTITDITIYFEEI